MLNNPTGWKGAVKDMEYIYPSFERGRVMKKESLEAIRDYAYAGWQLRYREYPDGIIRGCNLATDGRNIIISPGMIKCSHYIFLIGEAEKVAYEPTGQYTALKFRAGPAAEFADYSRCTAAFVLDACLERKDNEIELCRYKLKRGSGLRYEYKDLYDIQTEFDTLNLADATWSGAGGNTLSKAVTDYFARAVLQCSRAEWQDVQFAYLCLQNEEAVAREILQHYIHYRQGGQAGENMNPQELFAALDRLLNYIRTGQGLAGNHTAETRRAILVE